MPVPADSRRRAELAGVVFLCRLWQGSTDFTLDDARLAEAIEELLDMGEASLGQVEIAVPLRGFQMEVEKLELASATIVRADTVDVPAEARGGDGMGGAAWEPTFLAVTRVEAIGSDSEGTDLGIRAVETFKRVVTTLRLFKAGGVSLGPHAWVKAGGDRWRRVSTGAGKARPGGYRLADAELADLAALSRGLAHHSTPFHRIAVGSGGFATTLSRALSRFEAGLERSVTLEALNDYLLTLRFMLEGGGPASLGMSMRVAALCAEPDHRTAVKAVVDRAIALERELWSGEPVIGGDQNLPADVAAEVEDMTRAILRDAALGHLGSELRTTADEILLGEGLRVGEGTSATDRGETAEWGAATSAADVGEYGDFEEIELEAELEEAMRGREPVTPLEPEPSFTPEPIKVPEPDGPVFVRHENKLLEHLATGVEPDFEWAEPSPSSERERPEVPVTPEPPMPRFQVRPEQEEEPSEATGEVRILRAVPDEGPVAALIADSDNHRREVANRVSFLFPRPETTDWSVEEVGYDRRRGRSQLIDGEPGDAV